MIQENPQPVDGWLAVACPFCGASLTISAAEAHGARRCPDCGVRFLPLPPEVEVPRLAVDAEDMLNLDLAPPLVPDQKPTEPNRVKEKTPTEPQEGDWRQAVWPELIPPVDHIGLAPLDTEPLSATVAPDTFLPEDTGLEPLEETAVIPRLELDEPARQVPPVSRPEPPPPPPRAIPLPPAQPAVATALPVAAAIPLPVAVPARAEPIVATPARPLPVAQPAPATPARAVPLATPYAAEPPLVRTKATPVIPPEPVPPEVQQEVRRPPPVWPLLEGVYTFPWYPTTIRVWILLGLGLALCAALAAANYWLILELAGTGIVGQYLLFGATIGLVKGMVVFGLWTLTYISSDFLGIIQETAYGNDDVQWPDDSLFQRLVQTAYLAFLGLCAALPLLFLALPLYPLLRAGAFGWVSLFIPWTMFFPVVLLSSLANNSPWLIWNERVIAFVVRRPAVLGVLALASTALVLPCFTLGYFTVIGLHYYLAPVTGFVWSAALLVYARLLGRIAWLAMEENNKPARRLLGKGKKRKRPKIGGRTSIIE
jgi:hypothetical protein